MDLPPATDAGTAPSRRLWRVGFHEFLHLEVAGSIILLAATLLALIVANSHLFVVYEHWLHAEIGIHVGDWSFSQSVLHWIDDGLMALFFFVVGLEIKRELVAGELSNVRKATLPMLAALGGMIAPAIIYLSLNVHSAGARGWGIPMATDIAFALGVLALLGSRIPPGLKLFLTALAIADDIGAIIVIAIFYTAQISWGWLGVGLALLAVLALLGRLRVDNPVPYTILGLVVWFAFLNSGVHATIAGVLVAFTIPTVSRLKPIEFSSLARERLDEIEEADVPGAHVLENETQQEAAFVIRLLATQSAAPLQRFEHALHPWTTFVVLPLFAFANAGVRLVGYDVASLMMRPVALGIFLGLLLGKPIGISAMSWIAVRLGIAELPAGVGWVQIVGVGVLAGIGFTMSLFITNLAFTDPALIAEAKTAILITSTVAGAAGFAYLSAVSRRSARVRELA